VSRTPRRIKIDRKMGNRADLLQSVHKFGEAFSSIWDHESIIENSFRDMVMVRSCCWEVIELRTILLAMSLFVWVTGCTQQSNPETKARTAAEDPLCHPTPVRHFDWEQQAKSIAEQVKGIDQAVAVQIDDELDVAIKVSNFNRLRLESLRKEVSQQLKTAFPKANIHVTSDKKLWMDLQKLSETPWSPNPKKACKQKKQLKQMEKRMKG
jgi:hypothetical protein